ncbi:MAG: hypothetical protein AAF244_00340 [Pseudomonadota bacterium]
MTKFLHKPSQAEIDWFEKNVHDFKGLEDRFEQDAVTAIDLFRAREIFQNLTGASDIAIGFRQSEHVEELGGVVTSDSHTRYEAITAVKPIAGNKKRLIFNQVVGNVSQLGVSLFCRALPVTWSVKHIDDRNRQRNPQQKEIYDASFISVLGMGVMMAKILQEREMDTPKPVILPAERGVYLGVAQPSHSDLSGNRLQFYAASNIDELGIKTYQWLPEVRIHINTYFGPDQMNQNHRQLKAKLSSLLHGSLNLGFFYSNDQYMAVEGLENLTEECSTIYKKAYMGLDRIMNMPAWKNLRLPQNMHRRFDY